MSPNQPQRQSKLDALFKRIESGTKQIFTSENYLNFLCTMSKFHQYSFRNCLLIAMQKPDATYVAGYQSWQQNFNRHVNKGERGIQILAYAPHKYTEDVIKRDQYGRTIYNSFGKPVIETVERIIPRYRPVYVFDVSQTDGQPLPQLTSDLTGTVNNYDMLLSSLQKVSPYPIIFNQLPGFSISCHGYCSHAEQKIVVRANMSQEQTVKTIVHEIAHAVVHMPQIDLSPEQKPDRRTCEVQAESIAFIVCNYLNIDSSDYTFPYIAAWSSDYELKELQDSLHTIQTNASSLIDQVSHELDNLQEQQQAPAQYKPKTVSLSSRIAAARDTASKFNTERSISTSGKEKNNENEHTAPNI